MFVNRYSIKLRDKWKFKRYLLNTEITQQSIVFLLRYVQIWNSVFMFLHCQVSIVKVRKIVENDTHCNKFIKQWVVASPCVIHTDKKQKHLLGKGLKLDASCATCRSTRGTRVYLHLLVRLVHYLLM